MATVSSSPPWRHAPAKAVHRSSEASTWVLDEPWLLLLLGVFVLAAGVGCGPARVAPGASSPSPKLLQFEASAYTVTGTTASGTQTRQGIVAADPAVLPLGSRIRVHGAGAYSGVYTVTDTGPKVNGHQIDIFMTDGTEAKRFGRRRVQVEILGSGDRSHAVGNGVE